MELSKKLIIVVLLLGLGVAIGRYTLPERVVTREVEVVKEIEKIKYRENKHINTRIVKTTYPDGRIVEETYIVDESIVFLDKEKEKEITREIEKIIENKKPQWFVKAGTSVYPKPAEIYQVDVNRRILGPIFVGIYGRTDKEAGVSVGLEF